MRTRHTTLCIVNTTGFDITSIDASVTDGSDWDGDSRPDRNFQGISIEHGSSCCKRAEISNPLVGSAPALFQMTFNLSDGRTLSVTSAQSDASTKLNRFLDVAGTAAGSLVAFQTAGGDTNAIYLRTKDEPDNTAWMGDLLKRNPGVTINKLTMPGSHDAGMYQTAGCSEAYGVKEVAPEWAQTQSYTIFNQLRSGARYFDLRVYRHGDDLRIGHFGGTGGCYGPKLSTVLDEIAQFLAQQAAHSEAVFLKFSHTMSDAPFDVHMNGIVKGGIDLIMDGAGAIERRISQRQAETVQVIADVVKLVGERLETRLYTTTNIAANLARTELKEVAGKVIAVFDHEFEKHYDTRKGIFPYRDAPDGHGYGLRVYDKYADTDSFAHMQQDQLAKLKAHGGYDQDYLFLLSWTLTPKGASLIDVQVLSTLANPWLPEVTHELRFDNLRKKPNIIYWDFVDPYINKCIIDIND